MNSIQKLSICLLTLIALTLGLSGCSTLGNGDDVGGSITPERVYKITRLASYGTAVAMSIQNPGSLPAIVQARDGFCQLKQSQTWDLAQAAVIAQQNGLQLLESSEGQIILGGAPLIIDLFTAQNIDLKSQPYAVAVITGACEGLALATGGTRDIGDNTRLRLTDEAVATRPRK